MSQVNEMQAQLRKVAAELLENDTVGYIIGWGATRFPDRTTPVFIHEAKDADKLMWNEYCVNGLAKYVLDDKIKAKKIGICVRGCDSRAVNRLITDHQLKREDVYLIGLPCEGKADKTKCGNCAHKNPLIYDVLIGDLVEETPVPDRLKRWKNWKSFRLTSGMLTGRVFMRNVYAAMLVATSAQCAVAKSAMLTSIA